MAQNIYTGFHAVEERVRLFAEEKTKEITLSLYYCKPGPRIKKILDLAKQAGISPLQTDEKTLDSMVKVLPAQARDHRGIVLCVQGEKEKAKNYVQLDQWLSVCPQTATVILLDSVTDPHNVGAILRSCDQFGAQLLIVPEKRSASNIQDNDIIARSSAGASAYVPVAIVSNLVRAVEQLKEAGFWIFAADANGQNLLKTEFSQKTCIVMGSEGSGISKLLSQKCDSVVSIPTCGKIDSLNVSVAAGILLYERKRKLLLEQN